MVVKLIVAIGFLLALALAALLATRLRYRGRVNDIWRSLEAGAPGETFTEDMVSGLPEPAKRYLLHAIEPGTPIARVVRLKMSGYFRGDPSMPWMPMSAKEIINMPGGFVWKVAISSGKMGIGGADYWAQGEGRSRFFYAGIIPMVNAGGPDVSRASIGRFAIETLLLPAALLPSFGVSWEAVDGNSAAATFEVGGETVRVTLRIDDSGRLMDAVVPRWGKSGKYTGYGYIPFGAEFSEEKSFGGYTIPSKIGAGWHFGTDRYFEFFRATIEDADFG